MNTNRKYAGINWARPNYEIAREYGTNSQAIAEARRRYAAPPLTPGPAPVVSDAQAEAAWRAVAAGATVKQAAADLGLGAQSVNRAMVRRFGVAACREMARRAGSCRRRATVARRRVNPVLDGVAAAIERARARKRKQKLPPVPVEAPRGPETPKERAKRELGEFLAGLSRFDAEAA